MTNWYDKYLNLPYKHLGEDPKTGIDCFNLCRYVINKETDIHIPYTAKDFCNILDDNWFNKTSVKIIEEGADLKTDVWSCKRVTNPQPFDVVTINIGSSNITNHCALFVEKNKILQIMGDKPSWISTYGAYYKQYTTGIYRWDL